MLFALLLVLAQALAIQAKVVPEVDALCAGGPVELTSFAKLKELAAAARTSTACPVYLKGAIIELWAIIDQDKDNLCSTDAADTLRGYYTQYLDNASIKEDKKKKLPESLRKFVIAYGLQMSNLCKKQMVKVLSKDARNLLDAKDFEQLDELTNEKSALAEILQTMGGPDEIFLPGDLAPLMTNKDGAAQGPEKLFIQTVTAPWVRKLQLVCQQRFKPIYEPLMIPLVRLSYMGFNYKDAPLKCDLECADIARHVGQWSRIVFMCESLAGVHIVEDPESKPELTEGNKKKAAVKIISAEEAAAIEGTSTGSVDTDNEFAHFDYKPEELIQLGDVVLNKNDETLTKAVDSFKVGQSEAELAKRTMIQKGMSLLKSQLRKGQMNMVVSATYRAMTSKDANSPGSAIVRSLDEVVVANKGGETGATSGANIGEWVGNALVVIFVGIIFIVLAAALASFIYASILTLPMVFIG